MALRRTLRAWRRRLAVLSAVLSMAGVMALHHTGIHPMDATGMHAMTAVELCLAVLPLAVVAIALAGPRPLRVVRRWSRVTQARSDEPIAPWRPVLPRARAGPVFLSVMRR